MPTPRKGMMPQTKNTTPKILAEELGTNSKALRRFMRKLADHAMATGTDPILERVGQGNRYDLTPAQVKAIKKAWTEAHKVDEPQPEA